MKVFIQERLPALLLTDKKLSVVAINPNTGITSPLFVNSPENKKRLEMCDGIKDEIIEKGLSSYLYNELNKARQSVIFKK